MKRFRLSTLLLLIAIIAICSGLAVQYDRALRREAELRARLQQVKYDYTKLMKAYQVQMQVVKTYQAQLQAARQQSSTAPPQDEP